MFGHYRSYRQICQQCKQEFEPAYGVKQIYCTDACKQKAYRERKKALRLAAPRRNGEQKQ